jgi:hypothetical protein
VLPNLALCATAGWRHYPFELDTLVDLDVELVKEKEAKAWRSFITMADTYTF